MQPLKKPAYAFLIIAIMVGGLLFVCNVHAAVSVGGAINSDTTWTRVNSPYTLSSSILVNNGATLTIEPGVTVDLGFYQIQVRNGTLNARGTSDSKIVFFCSSYYYQRIDFSADSTRWNEEAGTGCIIEHAVFHLVSVSTNGGSPKISKNYFNYSSAGQIGVYGGAPLILDNTINFRSNDGIYTILGSPIISNNLIQGGGDHFGIYAGATAYISNNNITNCWSGIYASGSVTIESNYIMSNNNDGIVIGSGNPAIRNNALINNKCGTSGAGNIINNTIANNQIGIFNPSPTATITQNNIFDNTENSIVLTNPINVYAYDNWWGTTDQQAINQTIRDSKNDPNLGKVNFVPFLTEPNPATPPMPTNIPPLTPRPSPTPYPTPPPYNFTTPEPTQPPMQEPEPEPTPTIKPTPKPSPSPTPTVPLNKPIEMKDTFSQILARLDIMGLANMVIIVLAVMWIVIILVSIDRKSKK